MKIMIVEDEYYSRKALAKMIRELNFDLQIAAEAETGRQAVAFLEKEMVDLIITDIRMPEMDGLELSAYVAAHCPEVRVIIASGYSDFSYAQKAIRYGVKEYLLKPVKNEELIRSIKELWQEKQEQQISLNRQVKKRVAQETMKYLSIPWIIESDTISEDFREQCEHHFGKLPYRLFLFQSNEGNEHPNMTDFSSRLKEQFESFPAYCFYFLQQEEVVLLLFDQWDDRNNQKIIWQMRKLLENTQVNCGCSRIYKEFKELGGAYRDGIYAINRRLLAPDDRLFEYEMELNRQKLLSAQEEMLLYEYVRKCNYEQAKEIVEDFLRQCEVVTRDVYSLYRGIMQIFATISRATFDENHRYLLFSFKSDLYQFQSMAALREYMLNVLRNTCKSQECSGENGIIEEIKDYVARNYRYDISLKELACHKYFLNPSYLSRLFKQETGLNFSKYLMTYRLGQAKELLRHTDLKINEIADCVGYNNASYFIHIFGKQYQLTPEQYRSGKESKKSDMEDRNLLI